MKRLVALSLVALMTVSLLSACAKSPDSSTAKDTVLSVAAIETAYGAAMWQEVAVAFEKANPGVKVELLVDKNLEDVIGPNMKAGNYPDVVHLATGRPAALTETLIKENQMEPLTDVLSATVPGENVTVIEKIAGGFTESSLTNPYGDGISYLAPMFYSPCGLFYNAGLLQEKGWEVPKTWDEMFKLGELAKAEGIALFSYPTAGYFDAFFYALMYEVGGPSFFEKATHYEEGIWNTKEAKQMFDIVAKLATYTAPSVPANANNENYLKNQQLVLDNKALFMPNGTWVTGEMADAPRADNFKWGFTALPAIAKDAPQYSYTWFEQSWIPSGAKNKALAKQFIAFLYTDEAASIFAKAGAIQPIIGFSEKLEGENQMYYSIYENGAKAALGAFAATNPVEGVNIADTLFGTVNSLVSGDKTIAEWIAAVIKDSDALRGALK